MEAKEYLAYISEVIHTTIVATVDDEGLPITAAIDMMDSDESGLYFLTARGKGFYDRLIRHGYIALSALKGEDTMHSVAVSVRGKVRELGPELLPRLFSKNPYMAEIYPSEASRSVLTVFKLYEGTGEWFDMRKEKIEREAFSFGGTDAVQERYIITEKCNGCMTCVNACPQSCIDISSIPLRIKQKNCICCGSCLQVCPEKAVRKEFRTI